MTRRSRFAPDVGMLVRVNGWRGAYVIHKIRDNGDVDVWGGAGGRLMMRSCRLSDLRPVPPALARVWAEKQVTV